MRSEARAAAALTAAAVLALAGAAPGATPDAGCVSIDEGDAACPDLSLDRTRTPPTEQDGELLLSVLVANGGDAPSSGTRVVASSPGWDEGEAEVPELAEGGATEVTIALPIPEEARGTTAVFSLFVDPDQRVDEYDSDNNDLVVRAAVPEGGEAPVPDLRVATASHVLGTESVSLTATVANAGQAPSPATTVVVTGAGWEEGSTRVGELEPGANTNVHIELTIPPAARGTTAVLTVTVTPVEGEPETADNSIRREVAVPALRRPVPDLALTVTGHRLVDGGDRLEVVASVENIGSGDAPATRLAAAAPGWPEGRAAVPALAAGESRAVTVPLVVPDARRGGTTTFVLTVEPVPSEAGTDDNTATRSVAIPPPQPEPTGGGDRLVWLIPLLAGAAGLALVLARLLWRLVTPRRGPSAEPPPREERPRGRGAAVPPPARPPRQPPKPSPRAQPEPETRVLPRQLEPETEVVAPPPARVVNTGFADRGDPAAPLDPAVPLACGADYVFWLDVGPPVARSAERTPADLPWHRLPPTPELTVVVYPLAEGEEALVVPAGADEGALALRASGAVEVVRQPVGGAFASLPVARSRLLFPVTAPPVEADAQLRCSIFCHGTLVQSRLVTAHVRREPARASGPGFESVLDYTLAPALDPVHLDELPEPSLALMLNRSAATHDFTFYGTGGFKSRSSFDVLELQDLIERARAGLRRAAWGDEEEWREGRDYLYVGDDPGRLRRDLVELAKRGFRFYASIADRLAGEGDAFELSDRLARPGSVQIANVESPRHVLPAALLYDYLGFDSTLRVDDYTLCPRFLDALAEEEALEATECFRGECPSSGAAAVVCPSGFWGFRHRLGLPVSVADAPETPVAIAYGAEGPAVVLAASTDFELLTAHSEAVAVLCPRLVTATTRADTLRLMREAGVHLLYFYCHGGVQDRVPFLKVGGPNERGITGDLLFSERIRWVAPRPLVFINGCRTTALEPETAIELVSSLVRRAHASGVIGTEITVFEPLARDFAEAFLARFLTGASVGEAVRAARLALLARGNPLGLAYIAFALDGLRLTRDAAGTSS